MRGLYEVLLFLAFSEIREINPVVSAGAWGARLGSAAAAPNGTWSSPLTEIESLGVGDGMRCINCPTADAIGGGPI